MNVPDRAPGTSGRLTSWLSAAVIALAAIGPVIAIGGAFVSPSQIAAVALVAHVLFSRLAGKAEPVSPLVALYIFGAVLLSIGVLSAPETVAAAAAFLNFVTGTITGFVIGSQSTAERRHSLGALDLGFVGFVVITALQYFTQSRSVESAAELHSSVLVAWGGSNYVGAILVVAGFWLIARAAALVKGKWVLGITVVLAFATAVSTLSRGAIVALAAGLLVATWRAGKTKLARALWRSTIILVPIVGVGLMNAVSQQRFATTAADPSSNIDARFVLYRLALSDFISSPLVGTGWTALREETASLFGSSVSFAHNWIFSALQIAGVIAVPSLLAFIALVAFSVRRASLFGAPAAAAFTVAMVEPVMEGYVGALIICAALASAASSAARSTAMAPDLELPSGLRRALP